jgi:ribosome-associated protein
MSNSNSNTRSGSGSDPAPGASSSAGPGGGAFEIADHEVVMTAIRAQGPGGQNVNKVATAIHLRFDIQASSLPPDIKERLLARRDQRITRQGVVVIKAQDGRSQEKSREEAMTRLRALVASVAVPPKARRPTRPTRNSQTRRVDTKVSRGKVKSMRGRVSE